MEMGSGKSKVIIDNAGMLYMKGAIDSLVIIAPKGCYANWAKKEIPQHMSSAVPYTVQLWDSAMSKGSRVAFLEHMKRPCGNRLNILVINIESIVSSKAADDALKAFLKHTNKTMGVIDESTCIKTPTSKSTRRMLHLSDKFHVRRIATGSPITNKPFDLYPQCQFLQKGSLGYPNFSRFKNQYATFKTIPIAGRTISIPDKFINLDELAERIKPFSYRVQKKDCLDLPDKIYQTRYVELSPEQRRVYKQLKAERFAEIEGKEMTTQIALTTLLRLHQVICGCYKTDDGEVGRFKPNPRINSLMELIPELTGKTIIFANYIDNIEEIIGELKNEYGDKSVVSYYGATSTADRTAAIKSFEDVNSEVRFFVGNTQAAGRGITLVAAENVVYYSNNYSLELRQQSEDRAHRPGQTKHVNYIDLVAMGTLDSRIVKALLSKRDIAQEILQDDLEKWFEL